MKDTSKTENDADIQSIGDTIASINTLCVVTSVLSAMTSSDSTEMETMGVSPKYSSLAKNVENCHWVKISDCKIELLPNKHFPLVGIHYCIARTPHPPTHPRPFSDRNILFDVRNHLGCPEDCSAPLESAREGKFQSFYARCGAGNP